MKALVLVAALLVPQLGRAADWYVDPERGDDANDGSRARPLKTLRAAGDLDHDKAIRRAQRCAGRGDGNATVLLLARLIHELERPPDVHRPLHVLFRPAEEAVRPEPGQLDVAVWL